MVGLKILVLKIRKNIKLIDVCLILKLNRYFRIAAITTTIVACRVKANATAATVGVWQELTKFNKQVFLILE